MIDWFLSGINSSRRYKIKKAVQEMEEQLAWLDEESEHREEWLFNGELKNKWEWKDEEEIGWKDEEKAGCKDGEKTEWEDEGKTERMDEEEIEGMDKMEGSEDE